MVSFATKAVCRSVFLTLWHCILSGFFDRLLNTVEDDFLIYILWSRKKYLE